MPAHDRRKEDVLIGRIDERLLGLDRSFTAHEREDHERFELAFKHMSDQFDRVGNRFDKIDKKLDTLWDQSQRNHGAFSASRVAAGCIWGLAVIAVNWFLTRHGI